jgi:hypothetical protein
MRKKIPLRHRDLPSIGQVQRERAKRSGLMQVLELFDRHGIAPATIVSSQIDGTVLSSVTLCVKSRPRHGRLNSGRTHVETRSARRPL